MPDPVMTTEPPLGEQLGLDAGAFGQALFALVAELGAGLCIKDATTGRYLQANAAMPHCLGLEQVSLEGALDADLLPQDAWVPLRAAEQFAATQSTPQSRTHRMPSAGGWRDFLVLRLVLPAASAAKPGPLLAIWIDQSVQRQAERRLEQALRQLEQLAASSATDAGGGGVPLRPADEALSPTVRFEDQLRRELDLSSREHREFALVSVALDPFPAALLAEGETGLRRVQQAVIRLLRGNTRAMDASCRMDTGRFTILLSGVGLATAHARMEGLRRQCATEIIAIDGKDLRFTVSMGVASYPHTAQEREALVNAAEAALEQARQRGGNHVALASIPFEGH